MNKVRQGSIGVAVFGLDQRSQEMLRVAFNRAGKGAYELVEEAAADVGVVNMNKAGSAKLWAEYRTRHMTLPTIVLALQDPGIENTVFVARPIQIEKLFAAINKAAERSRCLRVSKNNHQAPTEAPARRTEVRLPEKKRQQIQTQKKYFFDPQHYLLGSIQHLLTAARKKKTACRLLIANDQDWQTITFFPGSGQVIVPLDNACLQQLCTTPVYCIDTRTERLDSKESTRLERSLAQCRDVQRLDAFLWQVSLWTAQGRVPAGTDLSAPIYLSCWPNLTRLRHAANIMRICTLLIEQARPLPLVARVLNIPRQQVFAFYTAAQSLGLVGYASREGDRLLTSDAPARHQQHKLLARILGKLKLSA